VSEAQDRARRGMDRLSECLADDARRHGKLPDSRRIEVEAQRIAKKAEHAVKRKGGR
jgi:hypothetical protein